MYWLLQIIGVLSLILGIIGAFLPIMPTTPFLILSAYCFSKTNKKWHSWLLSLPGYGPSLKQWEEKKIISKNVKIISIVTILVVLLFQWQFLKIHIFGKIGSTVVLLLVILFILKQKSE